MVTNHHPDNATLLAHCAGALDESASVVVSTHLALCPPCRRAARCGDHLGGALIDDIAGQPLSNGALARTMERLDAAVDPAADTAGDGAVQAHRRKAHGPDLAKGELPLPLARRLGVPLCKIRWRRAAPGVHTHALPLSPAASGKLRLVRIARGKTVPEHGHDGAEMTLVLSGSYVDKFGTFAIGDVADLDAEAEHQLVVGAHEDCICLVAHEAPVRFKSIVARVLQPFIGI